MTIFRIFGCGRQVPSEVEMLKPLQFLSGCLLVSAALLTFVSQAAVAQKKTHTTKAAPAAKAKTEDRAVSRTKQPDAVILQIMGEVSPQRIQQTIVKLAGFYTRSTLSVNNLDAATSDRGAVAARTWIKSEFERYSAACGGCLEAKTGTVIQAPKSASIRSSHPTEHPKYHQ